MEKPIYQLIYTSLTEDGGLPPGFSLPPDEDEDQGIPFADGAMDGITIYHMPPTELTEEARQRLGELLELAAGGQFPEAEAGFKEFCREHRAITIIDELQQYVADHHDGMDMDKLHEFAVYLLINTKSKECLKVALSIFEMFSTWESPDLMDAIRRLGMSDEFTIFSVFCIRRWPQADKEIYELAKRVKGWGRIHCVDFMEAYDKEIRQWLFIHGVDNDVLPAYSAWPVYVKAKVEAILERDDLSYEEIHALLRLTDVLMDEGPVSGISNLEDPKAYLAKVLEKAGACSALTEEDRRIIAAIEAWEA